MIDEFIKNQPPIVLWGISLFVLAIIMTIIILVIWFIDHLSVRKDSYSAQTDATAYQLNSPGVTSPLHSLC